MTDEATDRLRLIAIHLSRGLAPTPDDVVFMRGLKRAPAPFSRARLALTGLPPHLVSAVMEAWDG